MRQFLSKIYYYRFRSESQNLFNGISGIIQESPSPKKIDNFYSILFFAQSIFSFVLSLEKEIATMQPLMSILEDAFHVLKQFKSLIFSFIYFFKPFLHPLGGRLQKGRGSSQVREMTQKMCASLSMINLIPLLCPVFSTLLLLDFVLDRSVKNRDRERLP